VKRILSVLAAVMLMVAVIMPGQAQAATKGTFGKKAGYNGIRIGMSLKKAKATHKLKLKSAGTLCLFGNFKKNPSSGGVIISRKYGVVLIDAPKKARTPRGIGVGSTEKQVKKAYPDLHEGDHSLEAKVPGYSFKSVRFGFGGDGKRIDDMFLFALKQDCFN
jgi:hypothetical protein